MEKIRVGDLRQFLQESGWSPEVFAREAKLSHMTIRRWLVKANSTLLPAKYTPALAPLLGLAQPSLSESLPNGQFAKKFSANNVGGMIDQLEESGRSYKKVKSLNKDLSKKLKSERFDKVFTMYCRQLFRAIISKDTSVKSRAIAIGALLYFINPIDLIPDHIPVIGYLDDLAVLALAVNVLAKDAEKQEKSPRFVVARGT